MEFTGGWATGGQKWAEPAFPLLQGKVQKTWVHWERVSQRGRGLMLGELTRPHHPTSIRGSAAVSCPSSKKDQPQPKLHPGICVSPVPKPEPPLQAGWAQFLHDRRRSLRCIFDFNFSSLWKEKSTESQVSDLGEGLDVHLVSLILRIQRHF